MVVEGGQASPGSGLRGPGRGMPTCQLEVWAPSSGGHGGAHSHFPDSGQTSALIVPRFLPLALPPAPQGSALSQAAWEAPCYLQAWSCDAS